MIDADQVKQAMISKDIFEVVSHDCGICGIDVKWFREGEQLFFDSSCGCGSAPPQTRSWEDAVKWIEMQTNEKIKADLMEKWGLES